MTIFSTQHSRLATIKVNKVKYEWIIENYSFHDAKGEELRSPIFTSTNNDKCKWFLQLKPNNEVSGQHFMKLTIALDSTSECKNVFVKFDVFILNETRWNKKVYEKSTEVQKFGAARNSEVFNEFILKKDLFSSRYLPKDKLTIYLEVKFSENKNPIDSSHQPISKPSECRVFKDDFFEDFDRLYKNKPFADVVLSVKGNDFHAHKIVLIARSPVFAALFNDTKEEKNNYEITDIDGEVMEEMLYYMYTGKLKKLNDLASGLLEAADKYGMEGMKAKCEDALLRNLSVKDAVDLLVLANLHHAKELKFHTINFIVANATEVMQTKTWEKIIHSSPNLVTEVRNYAKNYKTPENQNHIEAETTC